MSEYNHPPMRNKTDGVWMARADYDALRKDAARYRIVRMFSPLRADPSPHIQVGLYHDGRHLGNDYLTANSLDRYCDEIMNKPPATPEELEKAGQTRLLP